MSEEKTIANNSSHLQDEVLTVEKMKAVMAEMEKHRLPHSVYNVGNATWFRAWLEKNKIIEHEVLSLAQMRGKEPLMTSLSGIEVVETAALKPTQMAYVENGVIRGVFDLEIPAPT